MSTLSEILQKLDDRKITAVPTSEWPELDGQLFARKMSAQQRGTFFAAMRENKATEGTVFVAFVVAAGTVDKDGNRVFTDEDFSWIVEKDADAQQRLFAAIDSLNFLSANSQETLVKNSGARSS